MQSWHSNILHRDRAVDLAGGQGYVCKRGFHWPQRIKSGLVIQPITALTQLRHFMTQLFAAKAGGKPTQWRSPSDGRQVQKKGLLCELINKAFFFKNLKIVFSQEQLSLTDLPEIRMSQASEKPNFKRKTWQKWKRSLLTPQTYSLATCRKPSWHFTKWMHKKRSTFKDL